MKQPNKEGSPSAEAAEERTSPKGNGGETAAARTLRRDTASTGLAGVRRAAQQSKSVRFGAFSLSLHPGKTRLIEFGRHAAAELKKRGIGRPETFAFLGFTFICGK